MSEVVAGRRAGCPTGVGTDRVVCIPVEFGDVVAVGTDGDVSKDALRRLGDCPLGHEVGDQILHMPTLRSENCHILCIGRTLGIVSALASCTSLAPAMRSRRWRSRLAL